MVNDLVVARRSFIGGLATSLSGLITVKAGSIVAEPMTLERACEVLSKVRHKGCLWEAGRKPDGLIQSHAVGFMLRRGLDSFAMPEFECIAIAEKYEREGIEENQDRGLSSSKDGMEWYRNGAITINEARLHRGLSPLAEYGDEPWVSFDIMPSS